MNSEVRREAGRTKPDSTPAVGTIKGTGQFQFPFPVPWKGTDLTIFMSAEK